jgi:hypothetical protein
LEQQAPAWHYINTAALHWPKVLAVAEFRKLIEEGEKQQQNTKP